VRSVPLLVGATGRLTEPLRYDRHSDRCEPIGAAFSLIGRHLQDLDHPDEAVLYPSGRTSNKAVFLFQLFGRLLGGQRPARLRQYVP